jgi:predicted nucleic acid-binding protein
MNDKYFIDTNIFVYSFDNSEVEKQRISKKIIAEANTNLKGIISYQVIQEFINVATKKFKSPLLMPDCNKYLSVVLEPLCEIFASIDLYYQSLEIMERWKYSFYDSLIIAAALKGNCSIIYSEDLKDQQKINDLTIINPFIRP